MALSKGKKVLIAIVGAVVTIGAVIGTVFAVKKIKENVEMTDRPGITTPVNPGQGDEGQKPGQGDEGQNPGQGDEGQNPGQGDEGQNPGQGDEGQNPGQGDEGQDPGQDDEEQGGGDEGQQGGGDGGGDEGQQGGGDEGSGDETPEISEEEYYEKNLDLIKAALIEDFKNDNKGYDMILDDETKLVINEAVGEIYFAPKVIMPWGTTRTDFYYTAKLSENFLDRSQKEIFELLNNKNFVVDFNFNYENILKRNLSEKVYNDFASYLLKQKYDFNGKGLSFSKEATVLNISEFISDGGAYGGKYIEFLVIDGNMIFTARLENAMPSSMYDAGIKAIMGYSNNVFKITAVNDFAEFGVDGAEQGGGEAEEGGYVLDLSEVPISKAEAASLAVDIWSLNPEKDMDVILPVNDSGLEM